MVICDSTVDMECLRWPAKEAFSIVTQQSYEITHIVRWQAQPEGHVGRNLAQGKIFLVLQDDGGEMLQGLGNHDGGLVMADPYHHTRKYHLGLTRRCDPQSVLDSSEKQHLVAQVLIIVMEPVLGILHLPLNDVIQIYYQHRDESDGLEHLVHVDIEIHIQPMAQP